MMPFHDQQLRFMMELARSRPEWLNPLWLFLNFFDTPYFFFVIIPVVWLSVSYQWGLRIFYWLTLNSMINSTAKQLVGWPRPNQDVDWIGLMQSLSNGFPSGGAQGAMFLGLLLIYYGRMRALGLIYIAMVSLSRIMLGVHYPIDVLGGWTIGAALFAAFHYLHKPIEAFLKKQGLNVCLILSIALPVCLMELANGINYMGWAMIGIGVGSCISLKYKLFLPPAKNLRTAIISSILGIASIYILVFFWPKWLYPSFAAAFFMSVAMSPICRRVLRIVRN